MGSNEKFYITVIKVLCFGAFISLHSLVGSKELHQESACYRDRLRINCGDHSFIAIHEAFFTTRVPDDAACGAPAPIEHEALLSLPNLPEDEDESAATHPSEVAQCYEDIRVSINRRCSGAPTCTYSYKEQSEKKCANYRGQFVVRYDCVRNSSVVKFCNTKLQNREGYFTSPGFPQYYPQLPQCGWTVSASDGQIILLKVLHLHLQPATEVVPTVSDPESIYALSILGQLVSAVDSKCERDSLTILAGGVQRASLCGESTSNLQEFQVECGEAEVSFRSSAFNPASGFLMYYKVEGCPPPISPDKSSRVSGGNGSLAIVVCEGDKVFNDTLEAERILGCVRDHHWNDTLPPCITIEEPTTTTLKPDMELFAKELYANATHATAEKTTVEMKDPAFLEDIIIPSVIMAVLVIGNAIIVAIILIIRKRNKAKMSEEDKALDDPKTEPLVADINDV